MRSDNAVRFMNKLIKQCRTDGVDCIVLMGDEERYDTVQSMHRHSHATKRNIRDLHQRMKKEKTLT